MILINYFCNVEMLLLISQTKYKIMWQFEHCGSIHLRDTDFHKFGQIFEWFEEGA